MDYFWWSNKSKIDQSITCTKQCHNQTCMAFKVLTLGPGILIVLSPTPWHSEALRTTIKPSTATTSSNAAFVDSTSAIILWYIKVTTFKIQKIFWTHIHWNEDLPVGKPLSLSVRHLLFTNIICNFIMWYVITKQVCKLRRVRVRMCVRARNPLPWHFRPQQTPS